MYVYIYTRASLVAHRVKRLPAVQETWVWSLGWEYPLEKEMATHSNTLAWRIPKTEGPSGLQFMGSTEQLHFHFHTYGTSILISNFSFLWVFHFFDWYQSESFVVVCLFFAMEFSPFLQNFKAGKFYDL